MLLSIALCIPTKTTKVPISPHPFNLSFLLPPVCDLTMKQLLNKPYILKRNLAKVGLASLQLSATNPWRDKANT